MRRGATAGFFEETGVALEKEDVEEEVEGERAKVEERGQKAPILVHHQHQLFLGKIYMA